MVTVDLGKSGDSFAMRGYVHLPELHKTTESGKVADSKWQTAPISLTNKISHHIPPSQRKGFVSNVEEVANRNS